MKTVAYSLFVASVLLVSGLARAEMTMPFVRDASYAQPVQIDQVTVDEKLNLTFDGQLPNPCYQMPSASLIPSNEPNVLILRLSSPQPTGICIQKLQPYQTTVDLPSLVEASEFPVAEKATYLIRTENGEFKMQVNGSDLIRYHAL